jgi:hypothetical protein
VVLLVLFADAAFVPPRFPSSGRYEPNGHIQEVNKKVSGNTELSVLSLDVTKDIISFYATAIPVNNRLSRRALPLFEKRSKRLPGHPENSLRNLCFGR